MRLFRIFLGILAVTPAFAQLTPAQKTADFMQLVGLYAKNYAPYELKRDLFGFDLYKIQPWLDQINKSTDDLTFYDILTKYVASLHDFHDEFITPGFFEAWLHMDADVYDGKVLIGDIDRSYLPRTEFPFQVGDEIVSVDGTAAQDLVQSFIPYAINGSGNPVSQMRLAAASILDRYQGFMPKAGLVGDNATVVVKRQNGNVETYTIAWDKIGVPLITVGRVPTPHTTASSSQTAGSEFASGRRPAPRHRSNPWGLWQGPPANIAPDSEPAYMQGLKKLRYAQAYTAAPIRSAGLNPFDNPAPVFNPPPGFKLRLGAKATDQFISGTFPDGKSNVGFIRIYTMEPSNSTTALNQFVTEMLYFQQNTDALVVDVMGNGGGSLCYSQELAQGLIPNTFRGAGLDLRATEFWLEAFSTSLASAQLDGAPQWIVELYTQYVSAIQQALAEDRGDTGPLPICGPSFDANPLTDSKGNNLAYTKPILLLTDNFTGSAGESFAMFLQDNKRVTVFGTRTSGGGGNVVEYDYNATDYSEGSARVTLGLLNRAQPVATPGFPAGPYSIFYEAQGIYPDIVEDYATLDNLLNGGTTFVSHVITAVSNLIQGGQ